MALAPEQHTTVPVAQQSTSGGDLSHPSVQKAARFLRDPRVQPTPLEDKIRFLRQRGVSSVHIQTALKMVGQEVSLDSINAIPATKTAQQVQQPAALPSPSAETPPRTETLYPSLPTINAPPPASGVDWRDVVIGVGAAALTGFGAWKLFTEFSPYELRRKDDCVSASASGRMPRGRGPLPSDERQQQSTRPPLPEIPKAPTISIEADERVKRLEIELKDTKDALNNERKRSAEHCTTTAKVRGEKQKLARDYERLTEQLAEYKEKIADLEKKNEPEADPEARSQVSIGAGEEIPEEIRGLLPKPEVDLVGESVSPAAPISDAINSTVPNHPETATGAAAAIDVAPPNVCAAATELTQPAVDVPKTTVESHETHAEDVYGVSI